MFWHRSQPLGLSWDAHAPPSPASSGISGHQPRNVIGSDPKQARRSSAVLPSARPSAVSGSWGQARSCSTMYGSPASLAAAAQPNQIGQLYGSVSGSPAQPVFGGSPRPEMRYQRRPSASVGPPATNESAPLSSVPRRSPERPGGGPHGQPVDGRRHDRVLGEPRLRRRVGRRGGGCARGRRGGLAGGGRRGRRCRRRGRR